MKKIDAIVRTSQRGSEALNRDVPLLGICRGAQFINAELGGDRCIRTSPLRCRRQFHTA